MTGPTLDYLLMCLAEQAGEITQKASKTYRFGQWSTEHGKSPYNNVLLAQEIGDLLGVVDMLMKEGLMLDEETIETYRRSKPERIRRYIYREKKA